ncbi:hypothetical protein F4801DRAFT_593292 [Xylaria longipes]|nr:hypothetical protein F4801DRAFT_593292 [Xylaria longipes]
MLLKLIHVAQIVIAAYGAMQSQVAISKLLEYKDATKKLAKISSEAGRQLHKTRTTQASCAVAILVSFLVSVLLTTGGASSGFLVRYLASPVMALAVFAARTHLQGFWAGKGGKAVTTNKIPLPKMGPYNEALGRTQKSLEFLGWLTISWLAPVSSRLSLQDALDDFSVPDACSILIFTAQLGSANRGRKGQIIGSRMYTVLLSSRSFCAVDVFVPSHPEVVALVWGSVKLTMQIIVSYASCFEGTLELFMQLGYLCPPLCRVPECLSNFHAAIIHCCRYILEATQRPWALQAFIVMWRSFDKEFKSELESVGRCSDHVKEAIAPEHDEASQGRSMISQLFKQTILDALCTHDYLRPLKQNQRKRYRDTANLIFRAPGFNNRANTLDTPPLWCSEKNHLMLTKANEDVVVSFFFVGSDDQQRPPNASESTDEMEARIRTITSSDDIDSIVALLAEITSSRTKFYIAMDGLDECDKPERTALLQALSSLSSLCSNAKLLVAGRDSLSEYIYRHFPAFWRISTGDQGTRNDIVAYITGYIYENDIRKNIKHLPRGLPETSWRGLRAIKTENHSGAAGKPLNKSLVTIRPLSLDELRETLAVEIRQRYTFRSLVQVDEGNHTVRCVHQTVRQFFLEDPVESDLTEFHFKLENADHTVGEICVTYLNFSDFKRTLNHMRWLVMLPLPSTIARIAHGSYSIPALILRITSESASSTKPIDIEPMINVNGLSSNETRSKTWRVWRHMAIYEHYGMLRLISSPGNTVRREIIRRAIQADHLSLLEFIMEMKTSRKDACRAPLKAAETGDLKVVDLLIAAGSIMTGDDDTLKTALYLIAARPGHSLIV